MQIVILAGGLATRLRPLTGTVPKAMLTVRGQPFLEHQIAVLRGSGIVNILLCVGHLGHLIEEHFGDGARFGVKIAYSWETGALLGTGGALRNARPLLEEQFMVLYGDSYLMIDYQDVVREFRRCGRPGLMVVYRNEDRYDKSNVVVREDRIVFYSKTDRWPDTFYIDAGLSAFRKEALDFLPPSGPAAMDIVFQELIARAALQAYETTQRFYEIGSLAGLEEFRELSPAT